MEPLGQRIRKLREQRGLSRPALAEFAGRRERWLYNVEQDLTDVDRRELEGLAIGLRVEVAVLLGFAPIPERLSGGEAEPPPLIAEPLRVAFAVVVDGPHVLLVRRRDNGIWSWPAAMVKPTQSPADAAVAETLAETGVHVSIVRQLGERLHPKLRAQCSYWLCSRQGGRTENLDPAEHLAVEWVAQEQVTAYIPEADIFPPVLAMLMKRGSVRPAAKLPVVVHAIIVQDRRALMIRRMKPIGALEWAFPAGQQEPGESFEDTAGRETFEETGLGVLPIENLGQRVHPYSGRDMAYLACRPVSGRARVAAPLEVAEVDWADLATVRERLDPLGIYPPVAEYLERTMGEPPRPEPPAVAAHANVAASRLIWLPGESREQDWPMPAADDLARLAEETSIGAGTVSDVEEATFRLRRAYSRTPPTKLAADLRARLASNQRLLRGVVRFSQRRDLMASTGWAALLLGTVCFDMEHRDEAWSYRRAALAIAQELGHAEMEAWCWETAAWFALADDQHHEAIRYSEAGIPGAPMASVLVALHLQIARAAARLGDGSATGAAIRAASAALDRLPDSEDNGDHYRFDAGKLPGFAAAAYVAIGEGRLAAEQARQSIAISGDPNSAAYRPMRVNSAHADLGHAALLLGDVDEAVVEGSRALTGPMLHPEAIKRVRELAAALQPHADMPEVRLFQERARAAVPR